MTSLNEPDQPALPAPTLDAWVTRSRQAGLTDDQRLALLEQAHPLALALQAHAVCADIELDLATLQVGDAALQHARSAAERYLNLQDSAGEARSALREGQLLAHDVEAAFAAMYRAARLAQAAQVPQLQGQALFQLARLYARLDQPHEAAQALTRALALDPAATASTPQLQLSDAALLLQGGHAEAARAAYHAVAKHTRAGDPALHAEALRGLADAFEQQGLWDRAVPFLERAAELAAQHTTPTHHAECAAQLACVHLKCRDVPSGLSRHAASVTLSASAPVTSHLLGCWLRFAELLLDHGELVHATRVIEQLQSRQHSASDEAHHLHLELLWARLHETLGNLPASLQHHKSWSALALRAQAQRSEAQRRVLQLTATVECDLARRDERRRLAGPAQPAGEAARVPVQQAGHSPLRTRAYGIEQLTRDFKRALRAKTDLSVAVIGIDLPADAPGSDAPRIEQAFVRRLLGGVRDTDTVAHFDTGKYMVLFPETTAHGARQVLDRLLRPPAQPTDPATQPLVSVGVCSRGFVQGAHLILSSADEQYYRARREGGNRVCIAE